MKLSTRTRYGLRAMLELSLRETTEPVDSRAIAASQGLSKRYLDNIIASLRRAGLVQSVRGASGGYRLSRAPETIRIDEIVTVLEGGLDLVRCDDQPGGCERFGRCATQEVWRRCSDAVRREMSDISLAELASLQRDLDQKADASPLP